METVKKPRQRGRDNSTSEDVVFSSGNSKLFDMAGDVLTPRKVALSRHGPRIYTGGRFSTTPPRGGSSASKGAYCEKPGTAQQ